MKTIKSPFCRDKDQLRNELLSGLMVEKRKSRQKSGGRQFRQRDQPQQCIRDMSKSKFNQNQITSQAVQNHNLDIQKEQQKVQPAPRIRLKLRKRTQSTLTQTQCSQQQNQLSRNIKKMIKKQLMSSFINNDSSQKIIDNRKTTYKDDSEGLDQSSYLAVNKSHNSGNVDSRVFKVELKGKPHLEIGYSQRSKVVLDNNVYLVEELNKSHLERINNLCIRGENNSLLKNLRTVTQRINDEFQLPHTQHFKQIPLLSKNNQSSSLQKLSSPVNIEKQHKFIPQDEVHIPKSFVTFTVKRKNHKTQQSYHYERYDQNEPDVQQNLRQRGNRQNERISRDSHMQRDTLNYSLSNSSVDKNSDKKRYLKGYENSQQDFLKSITQEENYRQKKNIFYNRHPLNTHKLSQQLIKNNPKPKTRSKSQKASSIKLSNLINTHTPPIAKVNFNVQSIKANQNLINQTFQMIHSIKNINKQENPFLNKGDKFYQIHSQVQSVDEVQKRQQLFPINKNTQSIKLTQSKYLNSITQKSLQSSLTYSTPAQHEQSINSLQSSCNITYQPQTINKLSSISKNPERELQLSISPEMNEGQKVLTEKDILIKSISNFREYERMEEQLGKGKSRVVESHHQKREVMDGQTSNQKENPIVYSQVVEKINFLEVSQKAEQYFKDFDNIFLKKDLLSNKSIKNQNKVNLSLGQVKPQKLKVSSSVKSQKENKLVDYQSSLQKKKIKMSPVPQSQIITLTQNNQAEQSLNQFQLPIYIQPTNNSPAIKRKLKVNQNLTHEIKLPKNTAPVKSVSQNVKLRVAAKNNQHDQKKTTLKKKEQQQPDEPQISVQEQEQSEQSGLSDFSSVSQQPILNKNHNQNIQKQLGQTPVNLKDQVIQNNIQSDRGWQCEQQKSKDQCETSKQGDSYLVGDKLYQLQTKVPKQPQQTLNDIKGVVKLNVSTVNSKSETNQNKKNQHIVAPFDEKQLKKPSISIDDLQDYYFDQNQFEVEHLQNLVQFDKLPDWKYNDKRDLSLNGNLWVSENLKDQTKTSQSGGGSALVTKFYDLRKSLQNKGSDSKKIFEEIPEDQYSSQIRTSKTSTKNNIQSKVRMIDPSQLQVSSNSSLQHENCDEQIQSNKQMKNKRVIKIDDQEQEDDLVSNRYISSSEQQEEANSQKSSTKKQNESRVNLAKNINQKKTRLLKQTSLSSQFLQPTTKKPRNTKVKLIESLKENSQSTERSDSNNKPLPLGIAKAKTKKQLFSVLQQSEQWHQGQESLVAQSDRYHPMNVNQQQKRNINTSSSDCQQRQILSNNQLADSLIFNHQSSHDPPIQVQQQEDLQRKLLEQEFGTKPNTTIEARDQSFTNKLFKNCIQGDNQSQKVSEFSSSKHDLSDFTDQQSVQQEQTKTEPNQKIQKVMEQPQCVPKPTTNYTQNVKQTKNQPKLNSQHEEAIDRQNQLQRIKAQRAYISSIKTHVQTLLKKVKSQQSISSQNHTNKYKNDMLNKLHKNLSSQSQSQKSIKSSQSSNNSSLKQPSIHPVSMSSESLKSNESMVEEYQQDGLSSKIRQQGLRKQTSFSRKNRYHYERKLNTEGDKQDDTIESHPLFDFSDKSVSDRQRVLEKGEQQRQKPNNKKLVSDYSFSSQKSQYSQQLSSTKSIVISPCTQTRKEVLKQFDEMFKQSSHVDKKDSFNKKHLEKYLSNNSLPFEAQTFNYSSQALKQNPNSMKRAKGPKKLIMDREVIQTNSGINTQYKRNSHGNKIASNYSSGSSGQHVDHHELAIVPQSLYLTTAKNTRSPQSSSKRISQNKQGPKQGNKHQRKGLSISKKVSLSKENEQNTKYNKSDRHGRIQASSGDDSSQGSAISSPNDYTVTANQQNNTSLWSFIMKK